MAPPSFDSQAAAERWHRFTAATVRAFHRYGTWLVSLSWWRFGGYSLLLLVASGVVQKLPPFSWTYTETVTESARHRHAKTPPAPPAPPSIAAPAAPAVPETSGAVPSPPQAASSPASAASAPEIHVTRTPGAGGREPKTVDIALPGIVIDTHDKTVHKNGVSISVDGNGIHISTDENPVDAARPASAAASAADAGTGEAPAARARAEAARGRAESAKARAQAAREEAQRAHEAALAEAASAASAAAAAASQAEEERAVDVIVGGQHVRIGVPAHADADDVKDAIDTAKEAIIDQLKQSEKDRERAERAAARAAARAKAADADAASDDEADADGDSEDVDSDGNRSTVRTHTVHYGEMLPLLAVWWVLGSLLLKITYKGRMQAEVKAAAATETAEAESLRRQVLEAKMAMMQAQVEPHFLFNTLASIDHLIEFDPKRASQMQRNLISLLRASMPSMRSTDSGLRPLDLELAVVRPYLEILKVRMEERLTTEIDVPDGLLSAEFPPMMIQTLVENSIKHGLEPKAEGGHLSVKAEIRHGKLAVTVADTGLGFEAAAQGTTHGTGVGLSNIRERLALLYGTKASLSIANNPVGGTIVTITVPYTAHEESAEGARA
jgi:signal transduction histidine kinase